MDFIPEIVGGEEDEVAPMPENLDFEPKEKTSLNEDDVFDTVEETYEKPKVNSVKPKEMKMKVVKEEPIIPETEDEGGLDVEPPSGPPTPKPEVVKPKRRRRGPMTEKQKKALAEGRAKALETRRKNALLKKEEKEMEKQLKEMERDKKASEIKKWKEKKSAPQQSSPKVPEEKEEPKPTKQQKISRTFTQDEVDEITFKAIQNYDSVRKARKAEKQKQKKIEEEKARETERLRNIVHRAKPESKVFSLSDIW